MPLLVSCASPVLKSSLLWTCTKRLSTGHRPCLPCFYLAPLVPLSSKPLPLPRIAGRSHASRPDAKEAAQSSFLQAKLPVGATIAPSTFQVQWILREERTKADAYPIDRLR